MTISVSDTGSQHITSEDIQRFALSVLGGEGVDPQATLNIEFVADEVIAELNQTHMGKVGPTDVLSFPIEDASPGIPPESISGGPPIDLGDIFIATNVVTQQATELRVSVTSEIYLMVCHGILHILGWDHQSEAEAEAMEAREAQYLATVGVTRR